MGRIFWIFLTHRFSYDAALFRMSVSSFYNWHVNVMLYLFTAVSNELLAWQVNRTFVLTELYLCVHRDIKPDNILLDEHGKPQSITITIAQTDFEKKSSSPDMKCNSNHTDSWEELLNR